MRCLTAIVVCHSSDRTMSSEFIGICLSNSLCDQFPFFSFSISVAAHCRQWCPGTHLAISAKRTSLIRFFFLRVMTPSPEGPGF